MKSVGIRVGRRAFGHWLGALALGLLLTSGASAETVRVTFLHVNDIYQHAPHEGRGSLPRHHCDSIARLLFPEKSGPPDKHALRRLYRKLRALGVDPKDAE